MSDAIQGIRQPRYALPEDAELEVIHADLNALVGGALSDTVPVPYTIATDEVGPLLESCPFCGSDNVEVNDDGGTVYVQCGNCCAIGPIIDVEDDRDEHPDLCSEATTLWNARAKELSNG